MEQQWPSNLAMEQALAKKKILPSFKRMRSNCGTSITTSSCQTTQQQKSASYHDQRYVALLSTKNVYMEESDLGITDKSEQLCQNLLNNKQKFPENTIFSDDVFLRACKNVQTANEARIVQDISRLLVPSAETLGLYHDNLRILKEGVNQGWDNSMPLTVTRPQPDYCVGFRRRAFTDDQLEKLSPFIGDFLGGYISLFMASCDIYFPFLTCEVKSGIGILNIADRQNAHSMALAVRGVVELLRLVNRMEEVNRQILAFSFSHNHQVVQVYGHYPVINGEKVEYYCHTIRSFNFVELKGRERWTAYQFTKNLYDLWMPEHFKMICSAIDQLPPIKGP